MKTRFVSALSTANAFFRCIRSSSIGLALAITTISQWSRAHQSRPPEVPVANPTSSSGTRPEAASGGPSLASIDEFTSSLADSVAQPSELRLQFNQRISAIRSANERSTREERDSYAKGAAAERDLKIKEFADARSTFGAAKHTAPELHEFNSRQELARKKLFAESEAKRRVFDGTMRENQKSFEDSLSRSRQSFENAYQAFVKSFYERKRTSELKQKEEPTSQKVEIQMRQDSATSHQTVEERAILQEFEKQKKTPMIPLQPPDSN